MAQKTDDELLEDEAILALVTLKSFAASPDRVGPFGAALLSWEVTGPKDQFRLKLNGAVVPVKSERVVQPRDTTLYRLTAVAGSAIKSLGNVKVNVNLARCETYNILNPQNTIEGPLRTGVESSKDIYFRTILRSVQGQIVYVQSGPIITFSPGRIRFKLFLGKNIDIFPDPSIDIEASFGLDVQDGDLVSKYEDIDTDISVPPYVWLLPGAVLALPIVISQGHQTARNTAREAIQGIVQLLNALSLPGNGARRHGVTIDATADGTGLIQIEACPYDQLVKLVKLSLEDQDEAVE